jgi:hypothetical protein
MAECWREALLQQHNAGRNHGEHAEFFIQEFRGLEIPDAIPAAVYDYYKSSAVSKRFSVSPQDKLEDLFSAVPEDVTDDARALVCKLEMQLPIEPLLREWRNPIRTLADMVRWLDWVRQHQS